MAGPLLHVIIARDALSSLRVSLNEPDFLLGSIAPDVRYVWGVDRGVTHLPKSLPSFIQAANQVGVRLDDYRKMAFCAGYQTHLDADKIWADNIYPLIFDLVGDIVPRSNSIAYVITDLLYHRKLYPSLNMSDFLSIKRGSDLNLMYDVLGCPRSDFRTWQTGIATYLSGLPQRCLFLGECLGPKIEFDVIQKIIESGTELDELIRDYISEATDAASSGVKDILEGS